MPMPVCCCAVFLDSNLGVVARISTTGPTIDSSVLTNSVLVTCSSSHGVSYNPATAIEESSLRPATTRELSLCATGSTAAPNPWPCWVFETPAACGYQPCLGNCSGHGVCNATVGACSCSPGWSGIACDQPAACMAAGGCDPAALCETLGPSSRCTCRGGWQGSGTSCRKSPGVSYSMVTMATGSSLSHESVIGVACAVGIPAGLALLAIGVRRWRVRGGRSPTPDTATLVSPPVA